MKLVYVTSRYPFGPGEAFLGPEIAAHITAGWPISIFPAYPRGRIVHDDASRIASHVPSTSVHRAGGALAATLLTEARVRRRVVASLRASQSSRIRVKNIAGLFRLGALVAHLRNVGAEHLHVHWGGTSSTLAMTAAEAVGIPWSLTVHRWDIYENNLLAEKVRSASFTRVISADAADDLRTIVPSAEPVVLHMGVDVPEHAARCPGTSTCRLVCVASLVPVKDHANLLAAFATLVETDATLDLVGGGTLEHELRRRVEELGLGDRVSFAGVLDHEDLLARLRSGTWDGIVLTSAAGLNEHEGIPVSLMEAMAAGVPALATDSGATRELVGGGAGIVVPAGDSAALASELRRFAAEPRLRTALAVAARRRVEAAFDVATIASELRTLFDNTVTE